MIYGMGFFINSYIFGSGASYLVDDYPSIFVAFAPIRLNSSTTNSIRVRRSSDNVEQDFTPEEVEDGTLTTWTGANDGFVVTAYNQGTSGSVNNITQGSSGLQPKIVSAGSLITKNGIPTFEWLGGKILAQNTYDNPEFFNGQDFTIILGTSPFAVNSVQVVTDRPYTLYLDSRASPTRHANVNGIWFDLSTAYNNTNMRLLSSELSSSGTDRIDTFDNGNAGGSGATGTYSRSTAGISLQTSTSLSYHSIYLAVNNVTDRSAIETEVNNIYSIY